MLRQIGATLAFRRTLVPVSIRIVLADDHRMLCDVLAGVLADEKDFEVVAVTDEGSAVLGLVEEHRPDVLIVDVRMPDLGGVEIAQRVRRGCPSVKVLALSGYTDKRFVQEMFKAGAAGYISKSAAPSDLAQAVRQVSRGRRYLCSDAAGAMLSDVAPGGGAPPPISVLTEREREVLVLLANGERSPSIAMRMDISVATVEVHRRNIMRKLGLRGVAELTKYAIREGLTST